MAEPKTVLVTGASSGLGRLIVEALGAGGYRTFAGLREIEGRNAQSAGELRALGGSNDFMIQMMLQGEYTVAELAEACNLPSAMASEHLRLMQRCGFLSSEKDGRCVYYRVAEPHLKNILGCIEARFGVEATAVKAAE